MRRPANKSKLRADLRKIVREVRNERRRAKEARRRERAKRRRMELIEKLGGHCVTCGVVDNLEINHVHGRDWEPSKKSLHCRVARYWREYRAGVALNVMCRSHNGGYAPVSRAQEVLF